MKQVHIRVEDELYEKLNTYSLQNDQSMQDCVREAVAYYVTDMRRKQKDISNKRFSNINAFGRFSFRIRQTSKNNVPCVLSANDTGATGAHQAGIYIPKSSFNILFSEPGQKGENKDKWVKIKWQGDFVTDTRFIYYGKGTRNEYRITNFGRDFPFLTTEYTGALFVFVKEDEENY